MALDRAKEAIHLVLLNSVLLGELENGFMQIPPVVVVDAGEHVVAGLVVEAAGEDVHQLRVLGEGHAGFDLVPEPERVGFFLIFHHQVVHQVAHLRHEHEQPRLDRERDHAPLRRLLLFHRQERQHQ